MEPRQNYYDQRGAALVKQLRARHFEAWYCHTAQEALAKALEQIPRGASVGWGGALTAQQIGLLDAVKAGPYQVVDRDSAATPQERVELMRRCLLTDVFISGANALSMDGQMVNIDGNGNRVAALVYGPKKVLIVAGMNKVADTLEAAVTRARTVAAPINAQRFPVQTPCKTTGQCADCKSPDSICNQLLITRASKPTGRIQIILIGQDLGF